MQQEAIQLTATSSPLLSSGLQVSGTDIVNSKTVTFEAQPC